MAKVVYVCTRSRRPEVIQRLRAAMLVASRRICPDNIEVPRPRLIEHEGVLAAIFAPSAVVQVKGASVCAGHLMDGSSWHVPGQPAPEGAFALFRSDDNEVEVLSDAVASRSIWHYHDDELFIAATSQRAIAIVLGRFDFSSAAIPWMVSCGTPGVDVGWDSRVQRVQPDSVVRLDRRTWAQTIEGQPIELRTRAGGGDDPAAALLGVLQNVFRATTFNNQEWVLPLSGGYDSRAILCLLRDRGGLRTVTWGLAAARCDPENDASVAAELATACGVANEYLVTDVADEPKERLLDRFVVAGEGGVDHLSGYMDGFAIWKTLHERGVAGIIRGDEGFGWSDGGTPGNARQDVGLYLWRDHANLPPLAALGLAEQHLPERFERRPSETHAEWRDRLYHRFRIPVILAALSDLKLAYVEVANPLLARSILLHVRGLPDHHRSDKRLFRSVVDSVAPRVRIARRAATADLSAILRSADVVAVLKDSLAKRTALDLFPRELLALVAENIGANRTTSPPPGGIDLHRVALRIDLVLRMWELLNEDARLGERAARTGGVKLEQIE
jgi:hypothetical protein